MPCTVGAVSNATISFPELVELLGAGYKGNITVSYAWLRTIANGKDYQLKPHKATNETAVKLKTVKEGMKPKIPKKKSIKKTEKAAAAEEKPLTQE